MKVKIREVSEKITFSDKDGGGFNYYFIKIMQSVKYVILYTDD